MSSTTKKFLVDNFANIAIVLSVIFLIFELNQNRRMMERELVFMEAQAFQMRADSALELTLTISENQNLRELLEEAKKTGVDNLSELDRWTLFDLMQARKIVVENTYFQVDIGLVDRQFWEQVGVGAIKRAGRIWMDLGIQMNPSFKKEVVRVLSEMDAEDGLNQSVS